MKLLAFLRDSYREALSGWVLQVMLGLSVLLVLFVASVSFRPVTLKDELDRTFGFMNTLLPTSPEYPNLGSPKWSIENYTQTNQFEPWKSDYAFDIVVTCPSVADLEKFKDRGRQSGLPASRATTERFLKQGFDFLNGMEVTNKTPEKKEEKKDEKKDGKKEDEKKDTGPAELRFGVSSKGTSIKDAMEWRHEPSVLFAIDMPLLTMSLREGVYLMEKWLVNGAGAWVTMLVSVIITAGFVPNMLGKGTFDLIASKPVSRPLLLVYKYVGGMTFVLVITTFTGLGVWLVIGVRTGIWTPHFLSIIPILTFYFAILYAVSTLAAVLTRSTLVAILATALAWALLWGIGKVNDGIANRKSAEAEISDRLSTPKLPKPGDEEDKFSEDDILRKLDPNAPLWGFIPKSSFPIFTAIHAASPRTYELDNRLGRSIAEGVLTERELKLNGYGKPPRENLGEMILVSLVFIAVCLGLATWRLVTRDG